MTAVEPAVLLAEPDPVPLIRPYTRTGGRTGVDCELLLESLLCADNSARRRRWLLPPEYEVIMELCRLPRSVAEVAARTGLPLGVTRVLLADMLDLGLLLSCPSREFAETPSLEFMARVLRGLHAL
ncbi:MULTISPECIES: DUF742 domain-containing protein [unclassified Crossiella]|uniref:DUF742 domain-containing protein n=1 Tax=unclassified Crossiella TaxID=2620835 RepID=UPI001FFF3F9F|nr:MULTISPECIES: DUF742 domain-containing protein [unclassified Crossiella]MCK2243456.1 DUF742 domain-containing protein [Crossiella sp. S99.2]MCK2257314.1 DUF742 domain-containing protein [Crossiella sp. S99.1]